MASLKNKARKLAVVTAKEEELQIPIRNIKIKRGKIEDVEEVKIKAEIQSVDIKEEIQRADTEDEIQRADTEDEIHRADITDEILTEKVEDELPPTQPIELNGKIEPQEENSPLGSEDELIELRPNYLIKRHHLTVEDIESLIVKCTACRKQINHHDKHRVKRHPHLGVLICKECMEFYGNGEFSQDEDGDKYCRWCAQGGNVLGCDYCTNVFCNDCIRSNFGRGESRKILEQKWKCYACKPSVLEGKVNFCNLLYEYSKGSLSPIKRKSVHIKPNNLFGLTKDNALDEETVNPKKWLPVAFKNADEVVIKFQGQLQKLKKKFETGNKSSKQLLKKLDRLTCDLRSNAKDNLTQANDMYRSYLNLKASKSFSDTNTIDVSDEDRTATPKKIKRAHSISDTVNELVNDVVASDKAARKQRDKELWLKSRTCDNLNTPVENGPCDNHDASSNETADATKGTMTFENGVASCDENDAHKEQVSEKEIVEENESSVLDNSGASFFVKENFVFSSSDGNTEKSAGSSAHSMKLTLKKSPSKAINKVDNKKTKSEVVLLASSSELSDATVKRSDSEYETQKNKTVKAVTAKTTAQNSNSGDSSGATTEGTDGSVTKRKSRKGKARNSKAKLCLFTRKEVAKWNIDKEEKLKDRKLKAKANVVLDRLPISSERIAASAEGVDKKSTDDKTNNDELQNVEQSVRRLLADTSKRKRTSTNEEEGPKPACKKKNSKNPQLKKAKVFSSSPSDSFSLDSSDTDAPEKKLEKAAMKKKLTASRTTRTTDEEGSSGRDLEAMDEKDKAKIKKRSNSKDKAQGSDSSVRTCKIDSDASDSSVKSCRDESDDDFIVKKKISKKDEKLLKKANSLLNPGGKNNDKNEKGKGEKSKDKKKRKRKIIYSDDSSNSSDDSSTSVSSNSNNENDKKKKKTKKGSKRKRIKIDNSSDENAKDSNEEEPSSQTTPNKGRKNIRKVISSKSLTDSTREAQLVEKERRRRLQERQKLYNHITDKSADGKDIITRKMVLEVDTDSKEEVVQIHPDVVEKLKPHQINGVKFMWEATIESLKLLDTKPGSGCILAHCMGLGKTLQCIAFIYTLFSNKYTKKKLRTAMIVCPHNTVINWSNEFEHWLDDATDSINVFEMTLLKDVESRLELLKNWQKDGGVLIIGYDMFSRLVEGKLGRKSKKFKDKIFQHIADPGPDIIVCDEGHKLKNEKSLLSRSAMKLKTARRIVLTGTPLQNNLKEYWCMLNFIKPRLLGTFKEFTNRFVNPITNGQYDDSSKHDVKLMKKRVHILHKLLEGCVQRCDYSALTQFLPPKHEFVISVRMSEVQVKMYRHYLESNSRMCTTQDGERKLHGGKLFSDYQVLKSIWSYPYVLQLSYERTMLKKMLNEDEDEDGNLAGFIDDDSASTPESTSGSDDDLKCLSKKVKEPKPGPSRRRGNDSSGDEVIKSYPRPKAEDESDDDDKFKGNKQWFHEFIDADMEALQPEMGGKMMLMLEILKECESIGDKVLIFSQSLLTLDIVELLLKQVTGESDKARDVTSKWVLGLDYFRMEGKTHVEQRQRFMDHFNNPSNLRARLFLISTKAGSLGTNLVGANRVILLDASWNPSDDVQSIFRVYRFGQVKPVYIYRFLAQGTMEEKIYNRQVTKLSMSCRVVDEQNIDRHFNQSQLSELYEFEPDIGTDRPTLMVPKDRLLANLIISHRDWIVKYFEHDSLLQSTTEDDLTEEERQAAWTEFENEKEPPPQFSNDYAQKDFGFAAQSINIPLAVKNLTTEILKKKPGINNYELRMELYTQLVNFRSRLQNQHVLLLRQKSEFVSKGHPVPPMISLPLDALVVAMRTTDSYLQQTKLQISAEYQTQQQRAAYNASQFRYPNTNPNVRFTQYVDPKTGKVHNVVLGQQQGSSFNQPQAAKPIGEGPTIVDITEDDKGNEKETPGSDPVVTLYEEPDTTEPVQKSSGNRPAHSVQITEVEE